MTAFCGWRQMCLTRTSINTGQQLHVPYAKRVYNWIRRRRDDACNYSSCLLRAQQLVSLRGGRWVNCFTRSRPFWEVLSDNGPTRPLILSPFLLSYGVADAVCGIFCRQWTSMSTLLDLKSSVLRQVQRSQSLRTRREPPASTSAGGSPPTLARRSGTVVHRWV